MKKHSIKLTALALALVLTARLALTELRLKDGDSAAYHSDRSPQRHHQ